MNKIEQWMTFFIDELKMDDLGEKSCQIQECSHMLVQ